jgi:amino acid transporter
VLNLANVPIGSNLVYSVVLAFGFFPLGYAFLGDVVLALVGSIFITLTYAFLTSAMPRSGGDYVYNSRLLHPAIGFGASFGLTVTSMIGVGVQGIFIGTLFFSPLFATLQEVTNVAWFGSAAEWTGGKTGSFVVGSIAITILALLLLRGTRLTLHINTVVFAIGMFAVLLMMIILATTSNAEFQDRFNSFVHENTGQSNAYDHIVGVAHSAGFTGSTGLRGWWAGLAVGMFMTGFYFWSTYIGGEIKGARQLRTTVGVMLYSQLINVSLFILAIFLILHTFGVDFIESITYLLFVAPDKIPFFTGQGAHVVFFTALASTSKALTVTFVIAFIVWGWPLLVALFVQIYRCAFAWSFDQIIPAKLCEVNPRTGTPVLLIAVIWAVSIVTTGLTTLFFDRIFEIFLAIILSLGVFTAFTTSIAGAVFPYRAPETYALAPASRYAIGRVPVVTITGIVGAAFTILWMSALGLKEFGITRNAALIVTFGVFAVGVAIFYIARAVRQRQGIPVDLVFTRVPPE